jgi:hypothetical protein
MNFKTKALFLFGILLFGLCLSYFLGGTFMEGFDTPTTPATSATPATPATSATSATPSTSATSVAPSTSASTSALAGTSTISATPASASTTPASTQETSSGWDWIRKLNEATSTTTQSPSYDNYNHYNDKLQLSSTQYYGSTGTPINPLQSDDEEVPEPTSSVRNGVSNGVSNGANDDYGTQYYSTMSPGIPASQILPGDEDLYILKSEIVPPVCPICPAFPSASVINNQDPPPPCPPCGRCPEPSFECKKVPNYNATNSDTMPVPVLNDFSSFGM